MSCPHTQEQNGVAERKHCHIVENGLALLAKSLIPLKYWDEAFRVVVLLHNRLPTPILKQKCPLELLFKTKPNYSFLKVFVVHAILTLVPLTNINYNLGALFALLWDTT